MPDICFKTAIENELAREQARRQGSRGMLRPEQKIDFASPELEEHVTC